MAGSEHSGIAHADPDLFQGAAWVFTPLPGEDLLAGKASDFRKHVEAAGAHVVNLDAERHDRVMAWLSHLPQMLATSLAATLEEEFADDPAMLALAGSALRDMTRVAASPYSMWRDIALTNTANLEAALLRLEQKLAHLRENLKTRELEEEFARANRFRASRKS
jgi:prephenate dehydrogenase